MRATSRRPHAAMLATTARDMPRGDGWTFEPKYDGVRLIAEVAVPNVRPRGGGGRQGRPTVRLMTRNGKDRHESFPAVTAALERLAEQKRRPFVVDGEVVAVRGDTPLRFQALQDLGTRRFAGRGATRALTRAAAPIEAAFYVFDILSDGADNLTRHPWSVRRARLEALVAGSSSSHLRLAPSAPGAGPAMLRRARANGWEGLIAKRVDSPYEGGVRSHAWRKLKLEHQQEFVVGGFTDPRASRPSLGALIVGYYEGERLIEAGNVGGGFAHDTLRTLRALLAPLERRTSPFSRARPGVAGIHWVRPRLVVEVRFNEWTADRKLRQPVFVGMRTDKDPRDVVREPDSLVNLRA